MQLEDVDVHEVVVELSHSVHEVEVEVHEVVVELSHSVHEVEVELESQDEELDEDESQTLTSTQASATKEASH